MKKTILAVFLVLFTVSCASLMDFGGVYRRDGTAVVDPNPYDPSLDYLLLGLYATSLIAAAPQDRYYYSPLIPPYNILSSYYCPPDVWRAWTPLQRSLWIQSGREAELRDYEYKLQSINDMQMFQMKLDVQSLIDDLKRAKEEAKKKD